MLEAKTKASEGKVKKRKSRDAVKSDIQAVCMILPQIIGLILFSIYPIVYVVKYAFYDYDMVTARFIGFDNFIRIFTNDPAYWKSILNVIIIGMSKLIVEMPLAFLLAYIIDSKFIRAKSVFRVIYYMPNVMSAAVVGLIYYFLFSASDGVVNALLLNIGAITEPIAWFSGKWTAMLVIGIASLWQGFGVNVLFFSSGMTTIPRDYYESADIDGATMLQKLIHITIPSLGPIMQVICMLAIINTLKMNDLVKVLTNGNPAGETEVLMLYLFKKFFAYGSGQRAEIGYAAALGVVTAIVLGIITLIYQRMTRKMNE
ncbi:MAG: sugar ABC transporter permease [Clostridia bacterium]|nr:sugar ABC transporter permease [Clostridia bacterium]